MKAVSLILFIFLYQDAGASKYYFSAEGDDANSGRLPQKSWKKLSHLTKIKLQPGDTLFFRRGDVFEGTISIQQSGTKGKPIVITAYGEGGDPVFTGAVAVKNWKATGGVRYEANISKKVYDLFANGKRLTPARFPNSGYLSIDNGYGKDSISCNALQELTGFWNGATLRIRTIDWVYETRMIKDYQKGLLIQGQQDRYPIEKSFQERTQNGKTGIYPFQKGYGFYLEGLPQMIDTANEWALQDSKLLLQMPEGKNPATENLEAVIHQYGIWLQANVKYIVVDGLQFRQYEKAGIGGSWHLANISITNNAFNQIHGAGILFDSASQNCTIKQNRFTDILGRGISTLEAAGSEISNNVLTRIGLERGKGWSGVNGATAILIHNVERKIQTDTTFANHNTVRYNRVDSCGYNGIRVDGSYNLVENNIIDHCSLTLNDGANLYCYAAGPNVTHHSIFRNNIVRYSVGDSHATPGNPNLAFGIYLDNNSHNMLVEGNTVIATGASGIVNNDASFNNTIINNTIYDCKEGIGFAEWANLGRLYGLVVENNTVVSLTPKQKAISITNYLAPQLAFGQLANNRYINLSATQFFSYTTRQIPEATRLDLSFEQWRDILKNDEGSMAVTATTAWTKELKLMILVNDTNAAKDFAVDTATAWDVNEKKVVSPVTLLPYQSKILLIKK